MRVHNQARDFVRFVGDDVLGEEVGEGQISQGKLGRHRSSADSAATPASTSPLRRGVAFASSSRRLSNL
jgi:hypothetical protein